MEKESFTPDEAPKTVRRGRPPKNPEAIARRAQQEREQLEQQKLFSTDDSSTAAPAGVPPAEPGAPSADPGMNEPAEVRDVPDYDQVQPEAVKVVRTASINRRYTHDAPALNDNEQPSGINAESIVVPEDRDADPVSYEGLPEDDDNSRYTPPPEPVTASAVDPEARQDAPEEQETREIVDEDGTVYEVP